MQVDTGFHHTCSWGNLEVCAGDKISPAFLQNFMYLEKYFIFTINIPAIS
jgi:hypothetical protein